MNCGGGGVWEVAKAASDFLLIFFLLFDCHRANATADRQKWRGTTISLVEDYLETEPPCTGGSQLTLKPVRTYHVSAPVQILHASSWTVTVVNS